MPGREEVLSGSVFRLAPVKGSFPANSRKPRPDHFRPSTKEKEVARQRGEPTLLSAFDVSRTTVAEAQDLRTSSGPTVAFRLNVPDVRRLPRPDGRGYLRVLRDPLPELAGRPGADGHCGIEGLARPSGAQKAAYKALRSRLCDLAKLHD